MKMKRRYVIKPLPKCDFCRDRPAEFDAPTKWGGCWAYMCGPCSAVNSSEEALKLFGTQLVEKEQKE